VVKRGLLKLLCAALIVASVGAIAPTPVLAQTAPTCEEDPSVDPSCAVTITDTTVVERDPSAPAGSTACRARTQKILAESLIGLDLWAYYQRIHWCFNKKGTITDTNRTRWAEVYAPGWDFRGHIGSSISGGVGSKFYTAFTQGQFRLCLVYCVQTKTPWIRQTGRGDGTYSVTTGG
jgi:hypothetical protein